METFPQKIQYSLDRNQEKQIFISLRRHLFASHGKKSPPPPHPLLSLSGGNATKKKRAQTRVDNVSSAGDLELHLGSCLPKR